MMIFASTRLCGPDFGDSAVQLSLCRASAPWAAVAKRRLAIDHRQLSSSTFSTPISSEAGRDTDRIPDFIFLPCLASSGLATQLVTAIAVIISERMRFMVDDVDVLELRHEHPAPSRLALEQAALLASSGDDGLG